MDRETYDNNDERNNVYKRNEHKSLFAASTPTTKVIVDKLIVYEVKIEVHTQKGFPVSKRSSKTS